MFWKSGYENQKGTVFNKSLWLVVPIVSHFMSLCFYQPSDKPRLVLQYVHSQWFAWESSPFLKMCYSVTIWYQLFVAFCILTSPCHFLHSIFHPPISHHKGKMFWDNYLAGCYFSPSFVRLDWQKNDLQKKVIYNWWQGTIIACKLEYVIMSNNYALFGSGYYFIY